MVARFPRPAFEYRELQRYQPQVSAPVAWFGAIEFVVLLNCVALFLWNADRMPLSQSTVWLAALAAENMVLLHQVFKPLRWRLPWSLLQRRAVRAPPAGRDSCRWQHWLARLSETAS